MSWEADAKCVEVPHFTELPTATAKRFCIGCPVMRECLDAALAIELRTWHGSNGYLDTVRGGLSAWERARMLRARTVNVDGRLVERHPA